MLRRKKRKKQEMKRITMNLTANCSGTSWRVERNLMMIICKK